MKETDLPPKYKNLWLKSLSAIETRNFDYAISLLLMVVKECPEFLDGRKALRKSEIEKKKNTKKFINFSGGGLSFMKAKSAMKSDPLSAMGMIEEALQSDPYNTEGNQLLYDCAMGSNLIETASFALETSVEGHPQNTKIMHQLAEHYLNINEPENASKVYNNIIKIDGTDLDALKGAKDSDARASMLKNKMESSNMQDWMRDKDQTEQLEKEGKTGLTKEQLEERLSSYYLRYEKDQNDLEVVKNIAYTCEQLGDYENALSFYSWAVELSPNDPTIERKLVVVQDKKADAELNDLKSGIENGDENDPDIIAKKENYQKKIQERLTNKINDLKIRIDKNPTDHQLRYDLGQALYEVGDYTRAVPEFQRSKNNPHLRVRTMILLAKCYTAKKMYDLAKSELELVISELKIMDNVKKEALYDLGLVFEMMNNREDSLNCMKEIYQVDYAYLDVAQRVEESYTSKN